MFLDDFAYQERLFCQRIRENCFLNGSEKDVLSTATTFRNLGKHYMGSNDEMGLIRSAVLFHAAIARNPEMEIEMKEDVSRLWQQILKCSNAKIRSESLFRIRNQLREEVRTMRRDCVEQIKTMKRQIKKIRKESTEANERKATINGNKTLQAKTTDTYCRIIKNLYDKCIKIMGNPPCKFTIFAMGALARKEITPMSDFYHAILLENDVQTRQNYLNIRKYFSWLSVLFHVSIVTLGETPLGTVQLKNLEWFKDLHTTYGLSSCKNFLLDEVYPLEPRSPNTGDFINTSDQMISYFKITYATSENRSNMADLLLKTSFITGNESLLKKFQTKLQTLLNTQRRSDVHFYKNLQGKIGYDKKNIEAIEKLSFLHSAKPLSYKRILYRSLSAFVATLGIMYGIKKNSSFDVIHALHRKNVLDHTSSTLLSYSIAVALECHTSICMKNLSGERYLQQEHFFRESTLELQQAIGTQSVVEVFAVAIRLQQIITGIGNKAPDKALTLKLRLHPKLKPIILCALHLDSKCFDECEKLLKNAAPSSSEGQLYRFLKAISNCNLNKATEALRLFRMTVRQLPDPGKERITCFYYMGLSHIKINEYKLAITYLRNGYQMQLNTAIREGNDIGLARFLYQLGYCARRIGQAEEAMNYFKRGLQIRYYYPAHFIDDLESNWLNEAGHCFYELDDEDSALEYFERAVVSCKKESRDERKDKRLANLLYNLALSLQYMGRFREALPYFEEELQIRFGLSGVNNKDISDCQEAIEVCKRELYIITEL